MPGIRIYKLAKELNLSITAIFEFLRKRNVVIDESPTTRVDAEVAALIAEAFASDKGPKERPASGSRDTLRTATGTAMAAAAGEINGGDPEIFISYASEDYIQARIIAEKLTALGARVWFDKVNLGLSDQYTQLIQEQIQKSKRFIPVISANTLRHGRRFFKKEWKIAIDEADYRLGEPFFAPIVIDNTDFDNAREIPAQFKTAHCIRMAAPGFDTSLKRFIQSYRNQEGL